MPTRKVRYPVKKNLVIVPKMSHFVIKSIFLQLQILLFFYQHLKPTQGKRLMNERWPVNAGWPEHKLLQFETD